MEKEKLITVNLILTTGNGFNGEGVWAEPITPEDTAIYENESLSGEVFKVKIHNYPFTTSDVSYGDIVDVVNMGKNRPVLATRANPN